MSAEPVPPDSEQRLETSAQLSGLVDAEAEQLLLGLVMPDNLLYDQVGQVIDEEHFGNPVHARIWTAVGQLIAQGRVANPVTLKAQIDQDVALSAVGGAEYLARCAGAAALIPTLNAPDYAKLIAELYLRRALINACRETIDDAAKVDFKRPPTLILSDHGQRIDQVIKRAEAPFAPCTLMSAFPSSRRVNLWLAWSACFRLCRARQEARSS